MKIISGYFSIVIVISGILKNFNVINYIIIYMQPLGEILVSWFLKLFYIWLCYVWLLKLSIL